MYLLNGIFWTAISIFVAYLGWTNRDNLGPYVLLPLIAAMALFLLGIVNLIFAFFERLAELREAAARHSQMMIYYASNTIPDIANWQSTNAQVPFVRLSGGVEVPRRFINEWIAWAYNHHPDLPTTRIAESGDWAKDGRDREYASAMMHHFMNLGHAERPAMQKPAHWMVGYGPKQAHQNLRDLTRT